MRHAVRSVLQSIQVVKIYEQCHDDNKMHRGKEDIEKKDSMAYNISKIKQTLELRFKL